MCRNILLAILCLGAAFITHHSFADEFRQVALLELDDIDSRIRISREIASMGQSVNWRDHTLNELRIIEQRISVTNLLARLGDDLNWQDHSLEVLRDRHARLWTANSLAREFGQDVDWREYGLAELKSMRERMKYAQVLRRMYGHRINGIDHSMTEMQDMRRKIIIADNSRRRGIELDWRNVTLPSDLLNGFDVEVATLVRTLANHANTTPARVLALTQKTQEMLRHEEINEGTESLVSAAWQIHQRVNVLSIPECLASYGAYRKNGMAPSTAVDNVIADHTPEKPIVLVVEKIIDTFRWEFRCSLHSQETERYYRVEGTIENIGQTEFTFPDRGTMIMLVDQQSREYSPESIELADQVLRPSLPVPIDYTFRVSRNSTAREFKLRKFYDEIDHFFGDEYETVPPKPDSR